MTYHLHMSGESRDCDGRYSHGQDIRVPKHHDPDKEGSFPDFRAIEYALKSIYRLPDAGPVTIEIDRLDDGRITIHAGGQTDEGYWASNMVVCDEDDFEEDYSGFRDHTAESMGY